MIDVNNAVGVQVEISRENVLWVNVDGICQLRSQGHDHLTVEDHRDLMRRKVVPEDMKPDVLDCILWQIGYENGDKEKFLVAIRDMSVYEAFDRYLLWNGIVAHTGQILGALQSCLSSSMTVSSGVTSNSSPEEQPSSTEMVT